MGIWKRHLSKMPRPPSPPAPAKPLTRPDTNFLSAAPSLRSSVAADTQISGRLSFTSPTRIDGTLHGEVQATATLTIGESGYVEGTVRPSSLLILGKLNGDIVGADRVEIGSEGRVSGSIETHILLVRDGGLLDGYCRRIPSKDTGSHPRIVSIAGREPARQRSEGD